MQDTTNSNKRIAKNTVLLYFRMLLTIVVGLYTSRVVLSTLGVSDYGIYNVVGGIVAILAFLNSALASASQRFIAFELGHGNANKLKEIFCASESIHIALAVIIFILAETIGLWFVNTHLNIAEERMTAANWVYQCSIFTFLLTIVSVPYNACIVAHEHMKAFAYVSIIEVTLKLLMVYLLLIVSSDKLIAYSVLLLCVALIIRLIYGIYCKKHFEECTYHFTFNCALYKDMFSFAGWSVIGNLGFAFRDQGSSILLNLFYGTAVNAARGIALQVNGVVINFSNNFMMALNPQVTKQYAAGDINESMRLVYSGCRYSFFLLLIISVPVIINIDYLLSLWLGSVPEYTSGFLILSLTNALINSMAVPLVTALQATGRIKVFQISICIIMLCELPIAYIVLHLGGQPYMAMYPTVFITLVALFARFIILRKIVPAFKLKYFTFAIVCKNIVIGTVCLMFSKCIHDAFKVNFWTFILMSAVAIFITMTIVYFCGLAKHERSKINRKIVTISSDIIHRIHKTI